MYVFIMFAKDAEEFRSKSIALSSYDNWVKLSYIMVLLVIDN